MIRHTPFSLTLFLAALLSLLLSSCEEPQISHYTIPKAKVSKVSSSPSDSSTDQNETKHSHDTPAQSAPGISWTLPETWHGDPSSPPFVGHFHVDTENGHEGSIGLLEFPPNSGSDLNFANYLAGSLQIPEFTEDSLQDIVLIETLNGREFTILPLEGKDPENPEKAIAVTAAIMRTKESIWFIRMLGSPDLVAGEQRHFREFLASLKIDKRSARPNFATGEPRQQPPAKTNASDLTWIPPTDWVPGKKSSMRKGSFTAEGSDPTKIDISVTAFPGTVGGLLSNINRWRGQIGLDPIVQDQLSENTETIEIAGYESTLVDFSNEGSRMVVLTVMHNDHSWFFKMSGDADTVSGQMDNYRAFINSVTR